MVKSSDQGLEAKNKPTIGIGLDSAVIPIAGTEFSLLQTCDYFYPIVDDPFQMGRITCANVVSDLYAMGVVNIESVNVMLKISTEMSEHEKGVVVPLMIDGFQAAAREAGCKAQTAVALWNPWCTIGGIATALCSKEEFIMPDKVQPGDVLVLTKPLGTQIVGLISRWIEMPERWAKMSEVVTQDEVQRVVEQATMSMARLNLTAARLMHKHAARGCTDVTGFGILGHAANLAQFQKEDVRFIIERLPVFENIDKIARVCGMSKLEKGISPETSGGLLIAMSAHNASEFCVNMEKEERKKAWVIGRVEHGNRDAHIVDNPEIIQVSFHS